MEQRRKAIQDHYSGDGSRCYGCGRLNDDGLHLRSFWNGREGVATFEPKPYHIGIPGYLYGGLLASLVDCHGCATAAAAAASLEAGGAFDASPLPRYVTASLHVDFLKPTPAGTLLELRARVRETRGRKAVIEVTVSAGGEIRARGEVAAVPMPPRWLQGPDGL
jgi:acyl-coenzyme A thioesterase PaaI-like protein